MPPHGTLRRQAAASTAAAAAAAAAETAATAPALTPAAPTADLTASPPARPPAIHCEAAIAGAGADHHTGGHCYVWLVGVILHVFFFLFCLLLIY